MNLIPIFFSLSKNSVSSYSVSYVNEVTSIVKLEKPDYSHLSHIIEEAIIITHFKGSVRFLELSKTTQLYQQLLFWLNSL